ncbi:unnamed protein product [Ambrosiozyma monospora]|uniref:Unnamed protein product n=1 Tax=Ambrosiozyma monospora TaxID=43982 RepID=A0A9W6YT19_AMBMO|nr:unnamed protein product [Ambrosiozyma monospora]
MYPSQQDSSASKRQGIPQQQQLPGNPPTQHYYQPYPATNPYYGTIQQTYPSRPTSVTIPSTSATSVPSVLQSTVSQGGVSSNDAKNPLNRPSATSYPSSYGLPPLYNTGLQSHQQQQPQQAQVQIQATMGNQQAQQLQQQAQQLSHQPRHDVISYQATGSHHNQYQFSNKEIVIDNHGVSVLAYKISQTIPIPPFANIEPTKKSMKAQQPKRSRRKSKFTKEQDELIINMKKAGKSWVEIAEVAGVGTYLAARNRYQVLIGQQGGGNSECGPDDVLALRELIDEGEIEKMKYLSKEFEKSTGKPYDYKQIRELLRYLFWKDPGNFDVDESYLTELMRLQEEQRNLDAIKEGSSTTSGSFMSSSNPQQQTTTNQMMTGTIQQTTQYMAGTSQQQSLQYPQAGPAK